MVDQCLILYLLHDVNEILGWNFPILAFFAHYTWVCPLNFTELRSIFLCQPTCCQIFKTNNLCFLKATQLPHLILFFTFHKLHILGGVFSYTRELHRISDTALTDKIDEIKCVLLLEEVAPLARLSFNRIQKYSHQFYLLQFFTQRVFP
jgi:hypothetical protein